MHNYKTLSVSMFLCSKRPLKARRIFLIQSETPEGPSQEMKEPEEKYEENNSPLLSQFLGQGLIEFLISRPSN